MKFYICWKVGDSKMLDKLMKILSYWYLQYELVTCLYVFEPWEKKLLNSIIVLIIALVAYSSYVYLPHYTMSLLTHMNILDSENLVVDYHYADSRIWIHKEVQNITYFIVTTDFLLLFFYPFYILSHSDGKDSDVLSYFIYFFFFIM